MSEEVRLRCAFQSGCVIRRSRNTGYEAGILTLRLLIACNDAGTSFNPVTVDGDAANLANYSQFPDGGSGGGTQFAGGTGSGGAYYGGTSGTAGVSGVGSTGGGGGRTMGGGGGSSYTEPGATGMTHTQGVCTENGQVMISW